jgi:hypothetical protein
MLDCKISISISISIFLIFNFYMFAGLIVILIESWIKKYKGVSCEH